ncbi:D-alanine--D-alanine ligase [Ascidiimonas sp. W6]|uniref:D-alanine--D-alanine ligase n=1 Tax=Ascidiimonas meishanensis TaxID=3128903 RepID=UPI0030EC0C81
MGNIKNHPLLIKWSNWEYWPMYILYVPVCIQHIWLSLKARNPFFFLTANPAIDEGFILSDSKYNTLQLVPKEFKPITIYVANNKSFEGALAQLTIEKIAFPVILKPDIGYRGLLVNRVTNLEDLKKLITDIKVPHIIQEYVDYDVEIGIFYYRFPNTETGHIPSITVKEFLSVTGDGKHMLKELVCQNQRAILQKEKLKTKFRKRWDEVLRDDEKLVLEYIGNHNRGTKFVNAAELYDEELLKVFDALNKKMNGFYYGRFDIRAKSIQDLKEGRSFKILEVNGIGAEPTHIYDPSYKILKAWKELLYLWRIVFKIASMHKKSGLPYLPWMEGTSRFKEYIRYTRLFK